METARRSRVEDRKRHAGHLAQIAQAPLCSTPDEVVRALDSITDAENERDLQTLEVALRSIAGLPDPALVVPALLRVFERFPWSDGFESFWTILHQLERTPGYEPLLIASVRRSPGEFNLLMINRLLNGGTTSVAGTDLVSVLREVAERPVYDDRARGTALDLLKHQLRRLGTAPA